MAAGLSLLLNTGLAQAADPAAPDTEKTKTDSGETIILSPFVVDASKDQGYRATNTLAGSRISTQLKDLAAPLTVVTREFLTDVAAVDINDIVSYTANTEGTRDFTASQSSLGRPTDDVSANPNAANRVRGLERAEITRDYFSTLTPGFDSYNLDEVTISRGPNSILAGVGHAGGIINYSPQLAGLAQNHNEASLRYGSFGDKRATLNSNFVAQKDVLAFRIAGVWSDRGFKQQPAWNKDKRLYLATTYKPWKKTTLHASYETVKIDANNPNSITPEDSVSQWVALGRPSYDRNSSAPVSSFLWQDGNLPTVMYNKSGVIEKSFNTNTGYYFNQQNLANLPIWTAYRMNSNKYLALDRLNLQPSLSDVKYKNFSVSVDQEVFSGLDANVAYAHEVVDSDYLSLFRAEYATYDIDVNQRLPDGTANPHYGESYMQFRGLDNKQTDHNTNNVFRGTLTYNLDLTKTSKWLGHHRLTGFYEDQSRDTEHVQYNAFGKGSTSGPTGGQEIGYRYYLGGSDSSPATTVPGHPGLVSGVPNLYFDGTSGTFKTDTLSSYYDFKSDNLVRYKLKSEALILQSYFWDDRIVPLFGIRRDKNDAAYGSKVNAGSGVQSNFGPSAVVQQDTKTYGVVVHPLKWLSLHYNHSENFYPNAGSVDLLGHTTAAPSGLGKDYGFSVSALDDKLNLKVNWFEVTAANGAADNANFPLAQWTIPFMELTVMPEIAAKAGVTYKQAIAPGLIVGDARLQNAYTSDNVSKGLEIELTYNVTKNWRIMGNISKQEAKQTNIASSLTAFIEERLAYWKSIPALWQGQTGGSAWGLNQTGEQHWNQFDQYYYVSYKSVDGKPSTQLAKWHASALTNYTFNDGALKGFSFGGAARYIEKAIIGTPAIVDSSGTVTGLDLAHPYYNGGNIAIDAWLGYKTKIFRDKYNLSFQLNGRDLEQSGGFRPILANSDGSHSVYRIVQPRTFYLTTTLEF
jgi:hypothetical protein